MVSSLICALSLRHTESFSWSSRSRDSVSEQFQTLSRLAESQNGRLWSRDGAGLWLSSCYRHREGQSEWSLGKREYHLRLSQRNWGVAHSLRLWQSTRCPSWTWEYLQVWCTLEPFCRFCRTLSREQTQECCTKLIFGTQWPSQPLTLSPTSIWAVLWILDLASRKG